MNPNKVVRNIIGDDRDERCPHCHELWLDCKC